MGVLTISKISDSDEFDVPFVKESIYWKADGRVFHVVRIFARPIGTLSGLVVTFDNEVIRVADSSKALSNEYVLNQLKEQRVELDSKQGTVRFDSYHYFPADASLFTANIGGIGAVAATIPEGVKNLPDGVLLAVQFTVECERRPFSRLKLMFLNHVPFTTHILMAPTTVSLELRKPSEDDQKAISRHESRAVFVDRFELWLRAEGRVDLSGINSLVDPKQNQRFAGSTQLEDHFAVPPMSQGWKLAINVTRTDVPEGGPYFNIPIYASFGFGRMFVFATWVFGLLTIAGLIVAVLTV